MNGTINLKGVIGEVIGDDGNVREPFVTFNQVVQQVESQREATHFDVFIDSPGGYVEEGNEIYNYLKALSDKGIIIHTHVENMCASIATKVLLAGSKRFAETNPEPRIMIHNPFGKPEGGDADYMEMYYKAMRSLENDMIAFYSDETGSSRESIKPLMKRETFLSVEEAKTLGFITDTKEKVEIKALALIKSKDMSKEVNKKELKNMMDSFMNGIKDILKGKAKNILIQDANGTEINFTSVEEGQEPEVGSTATIEGSPAEGEYTMPNGDVFVFAAGIVESITPSKEEEEESEEMTALRSDNEAKDAEILSLKKENEEILYQVKALKKDFKKLKNLAGDFEVDQNKKDTRKNKNEVSKRTL